MKRKRRYTVRCEPTGANRTMVRFIGVFHAVFGTVFALIALTAIIPSAGLFGLIFLAAGLFFAVNGTLIALGKNGLTGPSYRIETDEEEDLLNQGPLRGPEPESHDHIPSTALNAQGRLEQLKNLKAAGLITEQEYQQKRREIVEKL